MSPVLLVIVISVFTMLAIVTVGFFRERKDENRKQFIAQRKVLNTAESALNRIANGATSPHLEAQIAIDEIQAYYLKELN